MSMELAVAQVEVADMIAGSNRLALTVLGKITSDNNRKFKCFFILEVRLLILTEPSFPPLLLFIISFEGISATYSLTIPLHLFLSQDNPFLSAGCERRTRVHNHRSRINNLLSEMKNRIKGFCNIQVFTIKFPSLCRKRPHL